MLTAILGHLELTDFADSYVIRRGKDAEFLELRIKYYEIKIQPVL